MRKWLLAMVVIMLVSSFLLGACGKPPAAPPPAQTSAAPTTQAPATTAKPAPTSAAPTTTAAVNSPTAPPAPDKYGGILNYNYPSALAAFGYPLRLVGPSWWFANFSEEGLIRRTDKPGVYEPMLAESWDLAPDKSSYTFHLRKGVKFTDGTDFNADAVKTCYDLVMASKQALQQVKSVEVIDPYTVRLNLISWDSLVLEDVRNPYCYIISPTALKQNGDKWFDTHPMGTGPFIMKEFKPQESITWVKNPNYWRKGYPYLDGVFLTFISDPMTQMAALQKGEVDVLREVAVNVATQIEATKKYDIETMYGGHMVLLLNDTDPKSPWTDIRMREALEYAIDKEAISSSVGQNLFMPDYEILLGAHDIGDPGTTPRKYDPAKAKQLMADAGYANGGGLKITLFTTQKFYSDIVVAIQSYLADVGIQLDVEKMTEAAFQTKRFVAPQPNEFYYNRPRGGGVVIAGYAKDELSSTSRYNPGVKRPDGFDDLLKQAAQQTNAAKQIDVLEQLEKLAYNNAMYIPVLTAPTVYIRAPYVKSDVTPVFSTGGQTAETKVEYIWLEKK